jgi:hypothetical protein
MIILIVGFDLISLRDLREYPVGILNPVPDNVIVKVRSWDTIIDYIGTHVDKAVKVTWILLIFLAEEYKHFHWAMFHVAMRQG